MKDIQHNEQKIPKVQSEAVYQWRIDNTIISFIDVRLLISPLLSFALCVVYPSLIYGFWLHLWYLLPIVLYILHWYTASDCTFGIFCPLCCMSFIDVRLLIAPLVFFAHWVVYPSLIYGFWLHLWYLLLIVLAILHWFTASDCTFGIFCSLCCLSFAIRSVNEG
jgi:hypothetical protein